MATRGMQAGVLARAKVEVLLADAVIVILALAWLLVIQGPQVAGR